jgi:hypothetical protein
MEMMTISSTDCILPEKEVNPDNKNEGLFPENNRPNKFSNDKTVVFLTSRVHPGESPGSFMLNGLIDKIIDLKS